MSEERPVRQSSEQELTKIRSEVEEHPTRMNDVPENEKQLLILDKFSGAFATEPPLDANKHTTMAAPSAVFNNDTYLVPLGYLAKKDDRFFVVTNDGVETSPKRTRQIQEGTFLTLQTLSAVEPASSVPEEERANILFLIEHGMVLALNDTVDSWQDLEVVPMRRSSNLTIVDNLGNGEFRVRGAEGRETNVAELELAFWDRVGGGKTVAQIGAEVVSALNATPSARATLDEWLASVDTTFDQYLTSVAIAFMRSMGLMRVMTVEPGRCDVLMSNSTTPRLQLTEGKVRNFTDFTGEEMIVALGAIRTTDTGPVLVLNNGLVESPHVISLPTEDIHALRALNFTYWSNVPASEQARVEQLVTDGYATVLTVAALTSLVPVLRAGVSVDTQTETGYRISFDAHGKRQTLEIDTWQASLLARMGAPVTIAELIGDVVREVESDAEEAAATRSDETATGESLQMSLLKTAISFFGTLKTAGVLTIEPGV